jgi:hypothetical protein
MKGTGACAELSVENTTKKKKAMRSRACLVIAEVSSRVGKLAGASGDETRLQATDCGESASIDGIALQGCKVMQS